MKTKTNKTRYVASAALIAALYVVLTTISSLMGLSSGVIQVRFSEALTILPAFTPAAIPGLFIGCLISNIIAGGVIWDVIFGSVATLIGAVGTYLLKRKKWLVPLPPILANMAIVPLILIFAYGVPDSYWFTLITVGAGEIISCGILGMILYFAINKYGKDIFKQ
ncbi:MAG: QueT transporter family protein [Clostridiales bacterium]|nr:QueT transporter family protein [Clostridiales bacterium]